MIRQKEILKWGSRSAIVGMVVNYLFWCFVNFSFPTLSLGLPFSLGNGKRTIIIGMLSILLFFMFGAGGSTIKNKVVVTILWAVIAIGWLVAAFYAFMWASISTWW